MLRKNQEKLQEEVNFMRDELERKENVLSSRVTVDEKVGEKVDTDLAWVLNAVVVALILILAILICCMCIVISNRKR